MDGPALIGALAAEPEFTTIPVLLNSAVATPPQHLQVSAFLRKPLAASRLLELLQLHSSRQGHHGDRSLRFAGNGKA
jgi:hypothetical protein